MGERHGPVVPPPPPPPPPPVLRPPPGFATVSNISPKILVNVWVSLDVHVCARAYVCVILCACHKGRIESLRLSTCECMYMRM